MSDTNPKITSLEIYPKPEGTDFGQELAVEIKCSHNYEGRVDLRLCFKFNGTKGDAGGRTSVTIKNGLGKTGVRIPLHEGWSQHPAEKNKRPLVEYWFEGNIAFDDEMFTGSKIKFPTLNSRQGFTFQHIAGTSGNPNIHISTGSGKEKSKIIILPHNVSTSQIPITDSRQVSFITSKPATDTFSVFIKDNLTPFNSDGLALHLPCDLIEKSNSVNILHSFLNPTLSYMWRPEDGYKPEFDTDNRFQQLLKPVMLPNGFSQEDPIYFMEFKPGTPLDSAGLKEGWNKASTLTTWGKQIINETIFGSDIVPAAVAIKESYPLLKDFIRGDKFYIQTIKRSSYVIFSGPGKLREYCRGSRYRLDNAKVILLSAAKGVGEAAKSAVQWSKGTTIAFIFVCGMDMLEWLQQEPGQRFISDIIVEIASETAQTILSGLIAGMAVALGVAAASAMGILSIPVIAVIAGGLIIGIGVGFLMSYYDNRLKITETAQNKVRQCNQSFSEVFNDVCIQPLNRFIYQMEGEILNLYGANSYSR